MLIKGIRKWEGVNDSLTLSHTHTHIQKYINKINDLKKVYIKPTYYYYYESN